MNPTLLGSFCLHSLPLPSPTVASFKVSSYHCFEGPWRPGGRGEVGTKEVLSPLLPVCPTPISLSPQCPLLPCRAAWGLDEVCGWRGGIWVHAGADSCLLSRGGDLTCLPGELHKNVPKQGIL